MDKEKLMQRCLASIDDYKTEGEVVNTPQGMYIYKDNGSNVLAVAHLDTVNQTKHFRVREKRGIIYCGQLDDRVGAHIILDILPSLGIVTDVLLTEGEEKSNSTAKQFKTTKSYNWMFSFDRRLEDVVGYGYDDEVWRKLVKASGFIPAMGSVSDIMYLEELKCKGFNFGVGYENEHWENAKLHVRQMERQIARFVPFYNLHKDVLLPHLKKVERWSQPTYGGYAWENNNYKKSKHMYSVDIITDSDPEVWIDVDGVGDLTLPLSVVAEYLTHQELKDLVKQGHIKTNVSKFYLDKHIVVDATAEVIEGAFNAA